MSENNNVRWTCNIRSDFTENIIEYDKNHNPYTGYKLRCSYRDGIYVMKSKTKYHEYINAISEYFENADEKSVTVCEILCEIAAVRKEEKETEKSAEILSKARTILCEIMKRDFSEYNNALMKKINGIYYSVSKNDEYNIYDLYMLIRKFKSAKLLFNNKEYSVSASDKTISFNDKLYQSVDELILCAEMDGKKIYSVADEIKVIYKAK